MKFAHMADCHMGGWREQNLRSIGARAFEKAVDICMEKNVDFILVSGDLFNTSLPPIDILKVAVQKLKQLKDNNIPVYTISGSHDFSPSGKTMLDVLETAGLLINVAKGKEEENRLALNFTVDKKTGAKITGLPGKRAGLDKTFYESLDREKLESEDGYKIFMFHALLDELKTKDLEKAESMASSLLPKNFSYYAGGHVHIVKEHQLDGYGKIAYPGPLFPNNFAELESLGRGGFFIVENNEPSFEPIQVYNTESLKIDAAHKSPEQITKELMDIIEKKEFINTIVTLRVEGILASGKPSDIDFKAIFGKLYERGAYVVMKNTSALKSRDFEEIKVDVSSVEEVEEKLISEHLCQIKVAGLDKDKESSLVKGMMKVLQAEKVEGEKVLDFEKRVKAEMEKLIDV